MLRSYVEEEGKDRSISVMSIQNHSFENEDFWNVREFKHLRDLIINFLPDMDILINELGEPRVLLGGKEDKKDAPFESFQVKIQGTLPWTWLKTLARDVSHDPFCPYLSDIAGSKDGSRHPEIMKFYAMIEKPNALSVTRFRTCSKCGS